MAKQARLYERHFTGPTHAGLRKQIREACDAAMPACGPRLERIVLGFASTVALDAAGRATLAKVAADYRAAQPDSSPRCDCDACVAGGLQRLGAFG